MFMENNMQDSIKRKISAWELINVNMMDRHFELKARLDGEDVTVFSGGLRVVVEHMADIGFDPQEVEMAVVTMEDSGHDVAHFGILNKFFMFSYLSDNLKKRSA